MQISTDVSGLLETYLDLANSEQKVTAGNMANIDTPGYKTLGFDFDQEMSKAMAASNQIGPQADAPPLAFPPSPGAFREVDGLVSRPDGNNVSMDREGMRMAEAQLKFRTGIALLRQQFSQLSDAIHADAK